MRTNYGNGESNIIFFLKTNVLKKDQKILEIGSGLGTLLKQLLSQGVQKQMLTI